MKLSKHIQNNINYILKTNNNSSDIITRYLSKKIGYIFLESVSSDDKISQFLNQAIVENNPKTKLFQTIKKKLFNSNVKTINDLNQVFTYLANGFTVIFIEGNKEAITVETRSMLDRGVTESNVEPVIRGPKDSFTENHPKNIGLIRKRIKDDQLFFCDINIGRRSKTRISIAYINDIADLNKVNQIKDILNNIDIDAIIDSGYIRDFLEKENTLFPKVISTERPDLVCTSLLNGKVALLIENSPTVLILPGLFIDFIHSPEDYYQKPFNVTFNRLLRLICFIITITIPALYIALMTFNQELIPDELLIQLTNQRMGIPFPTALEVLSFVIVFEILREADIHTPKIAGSAISIVGALILGDAAVSAGIVSPIVIIIVAITSISELVFYDVDMISAVRTWRILFILATIFLGLIGFIIISVVFITKLVSIETLGIPYLTPITPNYFNQWKDLIIRYPLKKLTERPKYLTNNVKRMSDHEKNNH